MMKQNSKFGALLLVVAALVWGFGFVSQDIASRHMGAFTQSSVRMAMAGLALFLVVTVRRVYQKKKGVWVAATKEQTRRQLLVGVGCGVLLGAATMMQQLGIANNDTSPGKDAFITALYIVFVPVLGLALGRRARPHVYLCVGVALVGLWLLCMGGATISVGDAQVMVCSLLFAIYITVLGQFADRCDGFQLCMIQFFTVSLVSAIPMLLFEDPQLSQLLAAPGALFYSGVVSAGMGYTLQVLGQKHTPPTLAALLMSLESVFAVLASALLLPDLPPFRAREIVGMIVIFVAVVCSQLEFKKREKE